MKIASATDNLDRINNIEKAKAAKESALTEVPQSSKKKVPVRVSAKQSAVDTEMEECLLEEREERSRAIMLVNRLFDEEKVFLL